MKLQGAIIREQGLTFAIASVKPHIVNNTHTANDTICSLKRVFGAIPIVLMANCSGRPKYYGRRDIAKFLSNVPLHAIPWREYTVC